VEDGCRIATRRAFPARWNMISVPSMNERRVFRSMQTYLEKEEKCTSRWIRGVIGPNIRLAKKILLARFAEYRNRARYRDLQEFLASEAFQFTCDCDSRYLLYCRPSHGPSSFFPCSKCEWHQPVAGEIVAAFRLNEYTGAWERPACGAPCLKSV
jgi:hypothetical protein